MSKDVIFCLLWYNVIRWSSHICKKSSFLSFYSFLFLVNNTGKMIEENWQSVTKVNGVKNAIMQVIYFLNGPMFNLLFHCHIILCWEKMTSYEKFSHNLTLEVQVVWNFQKFQLKWKIVKYFTRHKHRAALSKSFLRVWSKNHFFLLVCFHLYSLI